MRPSQARATGGRGSVLLALSVTVTVILSFMLAGMSLVTIKSTDARAAASRLQAQATAEAGIEHGIFLLRETMRVEGTFEALDRLDPDPQDDIRDHATQCVFAQPERGQLGGDLTGISNFLVGQYDVYFDVRNRSSADSRTVIVRSRGYLPSKAAFLAGARDADFSDVCVRAKLYRADADAGRGSSGAAGEAGRQLWKEITVDSWRLDTGDSHAQP